MNITLDFTKQNTIDVVVENQPVAVMPAKLAQKLLRLYATKLKNSRASDIINNLIGDLRTCAENQDLNNAKDIVLSWAAERELIDNISEENWDAYAVRTVEQMQSELDRIHLHPITTTNQHNRVVDADSEEAEAIH